MTVLFVCGIEYRAASNECIRSRLGNRSNVIHLDPAVHFQSDVPATITDDFSGLPDLVISRGNETLSAKPRIYRHQQNHIHLVQHILQYFQGRGRIEYQAGFASTFTNQL